MFNPFYSPCFIEISRIGNDFYIQSKSSLIDITLQRYDDHQFRPDIFNVPSIPLKIEAKNVFKNGKFLSIIYFPSDKHFRTYLSDNYHFIVTNSLNKFLRKSLFFTSIAITIITVNIFGKH